MQPIYQHCPVNLFKKYPLIYKLKKKKKPLVPSFILFWESMNLFGFGFSKIKCEGSLLNWLFLNEKI
jgi:hypothetical protein